MKQLELELVFGFCEENKRLEDFVKYLSLCCEAEGFDLRKINDSKDFIYFCIKKGCKQVDFSFAKLQLNAHTSIFNFVYLYFESLKEKFRLL